MAGRVVYSFVRFSLWFCVNIFGEMANASRMAVFRAASFSSCPELCQGNIH